MANTMSLYTGHPINESRGTPRCMTPPIEIIKTKYRTKLNLIFFFLLRKCFYVYTYTLWQNNNKRFIINFTTPIKLLFVKIFFIETSSVKPKSSIELMSFASLS